MSVRALIFHMSIPCEKTFPWVPLFFTLWPWPRSLTYFLKNLTLLITFEHWVLELWYFIWVIIVTRSFQRYQHFFLPYDLDLGVWPTFQKTLSLPITFGQWVLELWCFFMSIPCDKAFKFFTLWPWPCSLTYILKRLTLLITSEQWGLELWYFTWVIILTRPFCGYQQFWSCDFDLGVWPDVLRT